MLHVQVDAAVGAGVARRADDHRHAKLARGEQHQLEVVRLPRERARRRVGAERNRTDVVAAGIGGDAVGPRGDAELEALVPHRREAEMPVRADDS